MKISPILMFFVLAAVLSFSSVARSFADEKDVVSPKTTDKLERVVLNHQELGGEIDRRLMNLIYRHYMVIDVDHIWLDKFVHRVDRLNSNQKNGFVYYGVGKLIDAGSLMARYTGDPQVEARTDHLIDTLVDSRDPDGYIGFWVPEPENQQDYVNWILHEQEYMNLAFVRNWRTAGNPRSLEAAKVMGDYILKTFPTPENPCCEPGKICTAGLPEGMLELYRVTGDKRYLDFAANTPHGNSDCEIRCESLRKWRQDFSQRPCHVYVMLARCYAQTELYRLDGDEGLLEMSRFMVHELLKKGGGGILVTGECSEGEHFVYNQNGKGSVGESCANAYEVRLLDSMIRLEGNLKYGDVVERIVYNALFAANSPDGRWIRYFTPFTGERTYDTRDFFCCCGNYRRAVAEIPEKVCYRTVNGGVCVSLFTDFRKEFEINGKKAAVRQETDYPNSGRVRTVFALAEPNEFEFRFRTPRWAEQVVLKVNDEEPIVLNPKEMTDGGYSVCRNWNNGDVVLLEMQMPWRLVRGREVQNGRAALLRGPVVFTLGKELNSELFGEEGFDPRTLTLVPESVREPVPCSLVRPDGIAVKAVMMKENGDRVEVTLTEFPDPSGQEIYFKVPEGTELVDDEIVDD